MLKVIERIYPQTFAQLEDNLRALRFKLVLNQLRKQDNPALGSQICKIIERHLGIHVEFAGNIAFDDHVHDAICQRVSFLDRYPYTRTAGDLRELSKQIVRSDGEQLLLRYS